MLSGLITTRQHYSQICMENHDPSIFTCQAHTIDHHDRISSSTKWEHVGFD